MNDFCLRVQRVLLSDSLTKEEKINEVSDIVREAERTGSVSFGDAYDALTSFLPMDDEDTFDVLADNLDAFSGWCSNSCWVWPDQPRITNTGAEPRDRKRVCIGVWGRNVGGQHLYLLGRRSGPGYPGSWEFPGGKREHPETNEECLVREWREELSLAVTMGPRLYTGRFHVADGTPFLGIAFEVSSDLEAVPVLKDHDVMWWARKDEILGIPDSEVTPSLRAIASVLEP